MALLLNCGAIFLHVPKTGGSWVERVLFEQELVKSHIGHKHADMERVLYPHTYREAVTFVARRLPAKIRGLPTFQKRPFIFCFVRHPLSWYESWWKFNCRLNWQQWGDDNDLNNWHPNSPLNGLGSVNFNAFIKNVANSQPGYVTDLYARYAAAGIGFVGRQENLPDDLIHVLRGLGLPFDEAKIRSRSRVNESLSKGEIVWDSKLRKDIERLEFAGITRYGYDGRPGEGCKSVLGPSS